MSFSPESLKVIRFCGRMLSFLWIIIVARAGFNIYEDPEMGISLTMIVAAFLIFPALVVLKFCFVYGEKKDS